MQKAAQVIEMQPTKGMLIEYPVTDSAIKEISRRFEPLEITDTKSYKAVTVAIGEVRGYRVSVEKKRKELKKDALEYGRKVDGEAKRITALLVPIEERLQAKKQIIDDRKEAERAEKARIEAERVDGIRKKISDIQRITVGLNGLDSNQLRDIIADVEAYGISADGYAEFQLEAKQAQAESINIIKKALGSRIEFEEEMATRKAESERLEKIRAEQEAERNRLAAETARMDAAREAEEARVAEAQAKIDAENQKMKEERRRFEAEKQAEIDRKEREALEKRLAVKAKIEAEKDAREKAERDELERAQKEDREAAEKKRQEALKPDKEKLQDFANYLLNLPPVRVKSKEGKILADNAQEGIMVVAQNLIIEIREM